MGKAIELDSLLKSLKDVKPEYVAYALATILGYETIRFVYKHRQHSAGVFFGKLLRHVRSLPLVRGKVGAELDKVGAKFEHELNEGAEHLGSPYLRLPRDGLSKKEILEKVKQYSDATSRCEWRKGMLSGAVYADVQNDELTELQKEVYGETCWSNPLHADVFGDVRRMEAEVVRMCIALFNGDEQCCGTMTSGGTESLMLVCKAYRDRAIAQGMDPDRIELVMPSTAHAAFWKSAQLMRFRLRTTPVDPVTGRADIHALQRALTRDTFMIVASAPNFPYGSIDDVAAIARLASARGIPLHVDSCLGGFVVPFAAEAGFQIGTFDFRVPGVSSISCDTHKYAGAPKGSSVVMYRNAELRSHQYFVATDWSGGIYATATFAGSRPGAQVATCWASLLFHGHDRYVSFTKRIFETARFIKAELEKVAVLRMIGKVDTSVVAFGSANDSFNIYRLHEAMSKRGWNLNALQYPPAIHIALTVSHTRSGVAERFVRDINECVSEILAEPNAKIDEAVAFYGTSQLIPDRTIVGEVAKRYLDACYTLAGQATAV